MFNQNRFKNTVCIARIPIFWGKGPLQKATSQGMIFMVNNLNPDIYKRNTRTNFLKQNVTYRVVITTRKRAKKALPVLFSPRYRKLACG